MTEPIARDIMGSNCIGVRELTPYAHMFAFQNLIEADISFSESVLKERSQTHILIYTPSSSEVTLNWFLQKFGTDPQLSEPCMYNQDWYVNEVFANTTKLDGQWHLIQKEVAEDMRAKRPEVIESIITNQEQFPTAVLCAFTFFVWYLHSKGEILWKNDFLWCSDRDHNNDRIYVGRYIDPSGVNRNGFNIHRHLALRDSYSAAPEVLEL